MDAATTSATSPASSLVDQWCVVDYPGLKDVTTVPTALKLTGETVKAASASASATVVTLNERQDDIAVASATSESSSAVADATECKASSATSGTASGNSKLGVVQQDCGVCCSLIKEDRHPQEPICLLPCLHSLCNKCVPLPPTEGCSVKCRMCNVETRQWSHNCLLPHAEAHDLVFTQGTGPAARKVLIEVSETKAVKHTQEIQAATRSDASLLARLSIYENQLHDKIHQAEVQVMAQVRARTIELKKQASAIIAAHHSSILNRISRQQHLLAQLDSLHDFAQQLLNTGNEQAQVHHLYDVTSAESDIHARKTSGALHRPLLADIKDIELMCPEPSGVVRESKSSSKRSDSDDAETNSSSLQNCTLRGWGQFNAPNRLSELSGRALVALHDPAKSAGTQNFLFMQFASVSIALDDESGSLQQLLRHRVQIMATDIASRVRLLVNGKRIDVDARNPPYSPEHVELGFLTPQDYDPAASNNTLSVEVDGEVVLGSPFALSAETDDDGVPALCKTVLVAEKAVRMTFRAPSADHAVDIPMSTLAPFHTIQMHVIGGGASGAVFNRDPHASLHLNGHAGRASSVQLFNPESGHLSLKTLIRADGGVIATSRPPCLDPPSYYLDAEELCQWTGMEARRGGEGSHDSHGDGALGWWYHRNGLDRFNREDVRAHEEVSDKGLSGQCVTVSTAVGEGAGGYGCYGSGGGSGAYVRGDWKLNGRVSATDGTLRVVVGRGGEGVVHKMDGVELQSTAGADGLVMLICMAS